MPAQDAHEHHDQDDRAQGHVGTVEPGEHEERRAIDPRPQRQPQLGIGFVILEGLQCNEAEPQQDGQGHPEFQRPAVITAQGVVGNGDGHTGTDQQDGVDQRQVPRVDHFLGRREQFRVGRVQQRPGEFERGPQHVCNTLGPVATQPRPCQDAHVEQRTEEGQEEHDFREDKPAHAPAERAVQLRAVQPGPALLDHCAKPAEQHVGQKQRTHEEDQRPVRFRVAGLHVVEPGAQAEHRDEHADGGNDRPLALRRYVVVLMTCHCCSPSLNGRPGRPGPQHARPAGGER